MSKNSDQTVKIAVIGDVHGKWESADNLALQSLGVDLVLFVGDFGNESVDVVTQIAALEIPKAAIMGNHDAWYTASPWGRKRSPYDHQKEDRVQQQLDLLGETHVGYAKRDFPDLQLSVVGSRPFSWGGPEWKNADFLCDRFGVNSFTESTNLIVSQAQATAYDTLIFLGHNGPTGLGEQPEDICGKDWQPLGGDHGDPDFAAAIAQVHATGKQIPLVTFGHMHHSLRHTKERLRTNVCSTPEGTIYFNAASVPRIREENGQIQRNFSLVTLRNGVVKDICLVWLGEDLEIIWKDFLFSSTPSELPLAISD